jgi:hypothetical protein
MGKPCDIHLKMRLKPTLHSIGMTQPLLLINKRRDIFGQRGIKAMIVSLNSFFKIIMLNRLRWEARRLINQTPICR